MHLRHVHFQSFSINTKPWNALGRPNQWTTFHTRMRCVSVFSFDNAGHLHVLKLPPKIRISKKTQDRWVVRTIETFLAETCQWHFYNTIAAAPAHCGGTRNQIPKRKTCTCFCIRNTNPTSFAIREKTMISDFGTLCEHTHLQCCILENHNKTYKHHTVSVLHSNEFKNNVVRRGGGFPHQHHHFPQWCTVSPVSTEKLQPEIQHIFCRWKRR